MTSRRLLRSSALPLPLLPACITKEAPREARTAHCAADAAEVQSIAGSGFCFSGPARSKRVPQKMQPSASGSWLRALCRVPRHQTQENIVNDPASPLSDLDSIPRDRRASTETSTFSDEITKLAAEVLGTSTARAQAILSIMGGLSCLAHASETELVAASIPRKRARMVRAALELARTSVGVRPQVGQRLAGASDVWMHMRARLAGLPVEEFWVIALDVRHRVVVDQMLARGSLTGVEVHPRDAFRPLIKSGAAAAIFCHNHPSGDSSPSQADIELTSRLREVGEVCGIAVLDHVVVGWDGYVSLAERNWR